MSGPNVSRSIADGPFGSSKLNSILSPSNTEDGETSSSRPGSQAYSSKLFLPARASSYTLSSTTTSSSSPTRSLSSWHTAPEPYLDGADMRQDTELPHSDWSIDEQLLARLDQNMIDPYTFERQELRRITEASEDGTRNSSLSRNDSISDEGDYTGSTSPTSFLSSDYGTDAVRRQSIFNDRFNNRSSDSVDTSVPSSMSSLGELRVTTFALSESQSMPWMSVTDRANSSSAFPMQPFTSSRSSSPTSELSSSSRANILPSTPLPSAHNSFLRSESDDAKTASTTPFSTTTDTPQRPGTLSGEDSRRYRGKGGTKDGETAPRSQASTAGSIDDRPQSGNGNHGHRYSAIASSIHTGDFDDLLPDQDSIRTGLLWYLNVHGPSPYRWERVQAFLYPNVLMLFWIVTGGGRALISLDLLNCTKVRSIPIPTHPDAIDDIGNVTARRQTTEKSSEGLVEFLCPFQLLYSDGIERLGSDSGSDRRSWLEALSL